MSITSKPKALTLKSAAAEHKNRQGLNRIWHACLHSLAGFRAAWTEKAFRLESLLAAIMLPSAALVGRNWLEVSVLAGSVIAVLIVELLNSAIETTVDRIGTEWNALSKRAKDIGSASVMLALISCSAIWVGALWSRWG
ncbi:diacylglycerol kinase [Stutzerimonas balearica]|jgi:diacylglycerol kinase (ATP)|uniref:diacylglycerol kinase n=1 Tax=Stutzerimonas balearica TaxID=74829 RepID=UPI000C4CE6C2|nr:diacylglycerol kinase [Pseudomonas sp.]|tara:strand:- start:121 stop:537 length:417 start_codon:yes stop_codon:yes gene_type:complete